MEVKKIGIEAEIISDKIKNTKAKKRLRFLVIGRLQNRCSDAFLGNLLIYLFLANQ